MLCSAREGEVERDPGFGAQAVEAPCAGETQGTNGLLPAPFAEAGQRMLLWLWVHRWWTMGPALALAGPPLYSHASNFRRFWVHIPLPMHVADDFFTFFLTQR